MSIGTELGWGLVVRRFGKNSFVLASLDLPDAGRYHGNTESNEAERKQFLEGRHMHKMKGVGL